jgi:hypothetical protein
MIPQDVLAQIILSISDDSPDEDEGQRVATVRMPAALHRALFEEARLRKVSMNKLAVSKLMIRAEHLDRIARELQYGNRSS